MAVTESRDPRYRTRAAWAGPSTTSRRGMQPAITSLVEFRLATAGASTLSLARRNMAIEKCPHCYRQVLPTRERGCPSCGQSIDNGPMDERAGKELLWLSSGTKLAPICVQCGIPTDETIKLQEFSTTRAKAFFSCIFRFRPQLILALIALFRPELAVDEGYRMLRQIPCCPRCRKSNAPSIHSADHHSFRLGILVRTDLVNQLNPKG